MNILPTEYVAFANQLADAAGAVIRPYFNAHGDVESKADSSPVTIADRAAEATMREMIAARFPEHGIYGEEFGITTHHSLPTTHNYLWVIDPIDGTRNFIAGGTQWGTLIALCENGIPVLGILDQPITGERWVGARGMATRFVTPSNDGVHLHAAPDGCRHEDGMTLSTRPCASLLAASISTTSARYFTPEQAKHFVALAEQCGEVIQDGDCYAYGMLANGQRDIVLDAGLKPYDILALAPIIEGAGGVMTNWDGGAVTLENYANVIASGDNQLHTLARDILR